MIRVRNINELLEWPVEDKEKQQILDAQKTIKEYIELRKQNLPKEPQGLKVLGQKMTETKNPFANPRYMEGAVPGTRMSNFGDELQKLTHLMGPSVPSSPYINTGGEDHDIMVVGNNMIMGLPQGNLHVRLNDQNLRRDLHYAFFQLAMDMQNGIHNIKIVERIGTLFTKIYPRVQIYKADDPRMELII